MSEIDDDRTFEDEDEMSIEAPEADALDQHRPAREDTGGRRPSLPLEADPADAADQDRVVDLDDDDYR
ncbi:hypothetical protein HTZ77_27815 [Nonomuraea sp. SMC257]|uniref:Uncharacterized protein n=1 Tax=Nonomuraea montanisoli TaxID=2741721 RepID=A0A7Y6M631_9ACTN|nr:hypothetical protein [Nonomuraea montanisoli]NUW35210.1 hypothetical protein [Nonomuraea montanisoli]